MTERSDGRARVVVVAPTEQRPLPGQAPLVAAALAIGVLLLGLQLWLLTVALDLFLGGGGAQIWLLALVSGLIFAGGVLGLWVLRRRPRMRRPRGDEAPFAVGAWGSPAEER
jgi:hypothetical protein